MLILGCSASAQALESFRAGEPVEVLRGWSNSEGRWYPAKFCGPSRSQPGRYTVFYDDTPEARTLLMEGVQIRRPTGRNDSEQQLVKFRQIHKLKELKRVAENERSDLLHRVRELDAEIYRLEREIRKLCSVLDNPDLDAMILQFAMSKGFAEATLTKTDLRTLYVGHEAGYRSLPGDGGDGVLITNAEIESLNGWYERRDNTEGPPANYGYSSTNWRRSTHAPCRDCNADLNETNRQVVDPASPITCQTCQDVRFTGRHWYEKKDGSYIYWSWSNQYSCGWFLRDHNGDNRYRFYPARDQMLTGQLQTGPKKWEFWRPADAAAVLGNSRRNNMDNLVAQTCKLSCYCGCQSRYSN